MPRRRRRSRRRPPVPPGGDAGPAAAAGTGAAKRHAADLVLQLRADPAGQLRPDAVGAGQGLPVVGQDRNAPVRPGPAPTGSPGHRGRRRPAPRSACGTSRARPGRQTRRGGCDPRGHGSPPARRPLRRRRPACRASGASRTPDTRRRSTSITQESAPVQSSTPVSLAIIGGVPPPRGPVPQRSAVMRMADRHRQRVGGIGAGEIDPWQKRPHHHLHLRLLGRGRPHPAFLDMVGGVLRGPPGPARAGTSSTTPRGNPELQRRDGSC